MTPSFSALGTLDAICTHFDGTFVSLLEVPFVSWPPHSDCLTLGYIKCALLPALALWNLARIVSPLTWQSIRV